MCGHGSKELISHYSGIGGEEVANLLLLRPPATAGVLPLLVKRGKLLDDESFRRYVGVLEAAWLDVNLQKRGTKVTT